MPMTKAFPGDNMADVMIEGSPLRTKEGIQKIMRIHGNQFEEIAELIGKGNIKKAIEKLQHMRTVNVRDNISLSLEVLGDELRKQAA